MWPFGYNSYFTQTNPRLVISVLNSVLKFACKTFHSIHIQFIFVDVLLPPQIPRKLRRLFNHFAIIHFANPFFTSCPFGWTRPTLICWKFRCQQQLKQHRLRPKISPTFRPLSGPLKNALKLRGLCSRANKNTESWNENKLKSGLVGRPQTECFYRPGTGIRIGTRTRFRPAQMKLNTKWHGAGKAPPPPSGKNTCECGSKVSQFYSDFRTVSWSRS